MDDYQYFGNDSTSVIEFLNFEGSSETEILSKETENLIKELTELNNPIDEELMRKTKYIMSKLTELNDRTLTHTNHVLVTLAIMIGEILNTLKARLKYRNVKWEAFAKKHFPMLKSRTRQKYMLIARRKDSHNFKYLGIDRLYELCVASKNFPGREKLEELFRSYQIEPRNFLKMSVQEVKEFADSILFHRKLKKYRIDAKFDLILELKKMNGKLDRKLIKDLQKFQESGECPDNYLKFLIKNNGKPPAVPEEDKRKRLHKINSEIARLINLFSEIKDNRSKLEIIDANILETLAKELKEIIDSRKSLDNLA